MRFARRSSLPFVAFTALFASVASAQTVSTTSVEVVESAPIETTLMLPGIRSTQEVWLEMIRSAQSSIDLEQFYITSEPGQALEPVLTAIQDAASKRSVKVRILVDSKFYKTYPKDPDALARIPNVTMKTIDFSALGGIQHAKYIVVDRAQAYVGSANFDWLALTHIHEVGLHVTDAKVSADLEKVFDKDWSDGKPNGTTQLESTETSESGSYLQVLASPPRSNPPGITATLDPLLKLLGSAKSSLKIQVYEYTTKVYGSNQAWKVLDDAIRQAASRGVSVQLMVDAVALKDGRKDLQSLAGVQNVQVKTVKIPTWSGGELPYARLIHSKYVVVDESTSWVGSENWSKDYFDSTRNVGILSTSAATSGTLGQIFDRVWTSDYVSKP